MNYFQTTLWGTCFTYNINHKLYKIRCDPNIVIQKCKK